MPISKARSPKPAWSLDSWVAELNIDSSNHFLITDSSFIDELVSSVKKCGGDCWVSCHDQLIVIGSLYLSPENFFMLAQSAAALVLKDACGPLSVFRRRRTVYTALTKELLQRVPAGCLIGPRRGGLESIVVPSTQIELDELWLKLVQNGLTEGCELTWFLPNDLHLQPRHREEEEKSLWLLLHAPWSPFNLIEINLASGLPPEISLRSLSSLEPWVLKLAEKLEAWREAEENADADVARD